MQNTFYILSIIMGFVGQGIGIYSILKGKYKPQRMTRFIYFLMSIIFIGTLVSQQSWDALGFALAQNIGGTIIFLLSFKYGMGGYNKSDIFTLVGAFVSGIIWITTSNPTFALFAAITSDVIAFIPTIIKTYKHPETEEWKFYFSDVIGTSFSMLSLTRLSVGDFAYPLYIFSLNLMTTILILVRQKFRHATKI
jgi:hypothetical protein